MVAGTFGMAFFVMASFLADSEMGLDNTERNANRYFGWACYFTIEAYGSLMVALFWSFTNSIMNLEQAKGAYGLIISIAQLGAIGGSTVATYSSKVGVPKLFLLSALNVLSICVLMKLYSIIFRDDATVIVSRNRVRSSTEDSIISEYDYSSINKNNSTSNSIHTDISQKGINKGKPQISFFSYVLNLMSKFFGGFYDGVLLIVKYPYVFYILLVASINEMIVTVMDYQFKLLASESTSVDPSKANILPHSLVDAEGDGDSAAFVTLLGHFGQVTNIISFFVSLLGFSFLVHRLGVRKSLMIFPIFLFIAVIVTNLVPTLYVLFVFVSIAKSLIFSLHDPIKELLYMPTTDAIKYKAAAWIDVFGCRFAKSLGSLLGIFAHGNIIELRRITEIPCIVASILFILVAYICGVEFDHLSVNKIVIGTDDTSTELFSKSSIEMKYQTTVTYDQFGNHKTIFGKSVQDDYESDDSL